MVSTSMFILPAATADPTNTAALHYKPNSICDKIPTFLRKRINPLELQVSKPELPTECSKEMAPHASFLTMVHGALIPSMRLNDLQFNCHCTFLQLLCWHTLWQPLGR